MRTATLAIAAMLIAGAAACKDDGIKELEATRDKVCECPDATCVDTALAAMKDLPTKDPRKAEAVSRDITDCVARIYKTSDAAPPEPDAAPFDAAPAAAPTTPPTTPTGP
jgi:hypothetical protein